MGVASEDRYFTVTQERQVKVAAASPTEAVVMADAVFRGAISEDSVARVNVLTNVKDVSMTAREDY